MRFTYGRARPSLVTADDLYRMKVRLDGRRHELRQGQPILSEPGGEEHASVAAELLWHLMTYVKLHNLGRVLGPDCGYVLTRNPDTVRAPDVSFRCSNRLTYRKTTPRFIDGAPDLAAEIMSPYDRFSEVEEKVQEYLRAGTRLVWVFRPIDASAIVYRADGTRTRVTTGDVLEGEDVVPGFRCRLDDLFAG